MVNVRLNPDTGDHEVRAAADGTQAPAGGGTDAPVDATYVVVSLSGSLSHERRLQATSPLELVDGGGGADLTVRHAAQSANRFLAGPTSGSAALPTFRAMVAGDIAAHASSHQHGGSDEIATATPGNNAIPKANGSGQLAAGWGTVAGTASTMMARDASGRAQVADPSAAEDIATKGYVDARDLEPSGYRSGNHILNWPVQTAQSGLPEWWDVEANLTPTITSAATAGISDAYGKDLFKIVGNASGSGKAVYQRQTYGGRRYLASGVAVSAGVHVYVVTSGTLTFELKTSAGTVLDTETTTTTGSWVFLPIENVTLGGTYVDWRLYHSANSATFYFQNPSLWVGPKCRPFEVNPIAFVHSLSANIVNATDPADTNWHAASFAAVTSPRTFAIQVDGNFVQGATVGRQLHLRPTFSSASQDNSTFLTNNSVANGRATCPKTSHCDDAQSIDWSVNNADVTAVSLSATGFWEWLY